MVSVSLGRGAASQKGDGTVSLAARVFGGIGSSQDRCGMVSGRKGAVPLAV